MTKPTVHVQPLDAQRSLVKLSDRCWYSVKRYKRQYKGATASVTAYFGFAGMTAAYQFVRQFKQSFPSAQAEIRQSLRLSTEVEVKVTKVSAADLERFCWELVQCGRDVMPKVEPQQPATVGDRKVVPLVKPQPQPVAVAAGGSPTGHPDITHRSGRTLYKGFSID